MGAHGPSSPPCHTGDRRPRRPLTLSAPRSDRARWITALTQWERQGLGPTPRGGECSPHGHRTPGWRPLSHPRWAGGVCWPGGTHHAQPPGSPGQVRGPPVYTDPAVSGPPLSVVAEDAARAQEPGEAGRPTGLSPQPRPLKARMPVPGTLALKAACPVAFGGAQLQPREAATAPGHEAVLRHGALPASGLSATHPPGGQSRR